MRRCSKARSLPLSSSSASIDRQIGMQDAAHAPRRSPACRHRAAGEGRRDGLDLRDLEGQRAGVEGIEHDHVAHRRQRQADQVARAIGDLAVGEIEQQVEIVGRGVRRRERRGEAAGVDAALDPPAHVEEAPAGDAVHVLLRQAGQRREGLQGLVGALEGLGLRTAATHPRSSSRALEVEQQRPEVGRQALAHAGGGAPRLARPGRPPSRSSRVRAGRPCGIEMPRPRRHSSARHGAPGDQQLLQAFQRLGACRVRSASESIRLVHRLRTRRRVASARSR